MKRIKHSWGLFVFVFILSVSLLHFFGDTNAYAASNNDRVADCYNSDSAECQDEGDQSPTSEIQQTENPGNLVGPLTYVKMIAALLFVLVILYFLLKFINKRSQSYHQNKLIQNIGGTSLGGNRSIQVIKVDKQILILGVGQDIKLLKEINSEDEVRDYLQQYNEQIEQSIQPAQFIAKLFTKYRQKSTTSKVDKQKPFYEQLQSQLKEMKQERADAMAKINQKENKKNE